MAAQLANEHCCSRHCYRTCEQNSIVNNIRGGHWTTELAIFASNEKSETSLPLKLLRFIS